MTEYYSGLKLYAIAKEKGKVLGLQTSSKKMERLIQDIQEKEGHSPCFRRQETCSEITCCWQAACGAKWLE